MPSGRHGLCQKCVTSDGQLWTGLLAGATVARVLMSVAALCFYRRAFFLRTRPCWFGLWAYLERLLGRPTREAMRAVV